MQEIEGFILELYRNGEEKPCYVSSFNPGAVAGFDAYTQDKAEAVVFESREALIPLASIEVEAVEGDEDDEDENTVEHFVFDGFRILPFFGKTSAQLVSNEELNDALVEFES